MRRLLCLLVLLGASMGAQALTATFTPRGHGDEGPALQSLYDKLILLGGGELDIENPPLGLHCEIDTPIRIVSDMGTVDTVGHGLRYDALRYGGPAGACFTAIGLKTSRFAGIPLILTTSASLGWDFAGDAAHQSESEITLERCRVQAAAGTVNCTGIRIGNTGNDHSDYTIDRFTFLSSVPCSPSDVPGALARVHAAGHRSVEILGWNTFNVALIGCSATACDVAYSQQGRVGESQQTGGDNTSFTGCGGSFNVLAWLLDGNYSSWFKGGRWENGGGLLVHGARLQGGAGTGKLTLEDILVAGYDARANRSLGWLDDGALLGINSNAAVRVDNLYGLGDQVDPSRWIAVRSNSGGGPVLSVARSIYGFGSLRPVEGKISAVSQAAAIGGQ